MFSISAAADETLLSKEGLKKKLENFILDFSSQDFFGIKIGTFNNYYVIEGPREPPVFKQYLREYYQIQTDIHTLKNPYHVGIAVTSNQGKWSEKYQYTKENIIYAANIWSKEPCMKNNKFYELDKYLHEKLGFSHKDRLATVQKHNWLQFDYRKANNLESASIYCDGIGEEEINIEYINTGTARKYLNPESKKNLDKELVELQKQINELKSKSNTK